MCRMRRTKTNTRVATGEMCSRFPGRRLSFSLSFSFFLSLVRASPRATHSRNCSLVSFARASAERKKGGTERRAREKRGRKHTRVIPANFREIALTSFSRGHTAIATLPPVRPGSILRLTQQRISPTRQRILLLVTVSEYRGYRRNFRPRRIYRARARWRRKPRPGSPHLFSPLRAVPLSLFFSPSLDGVILAEETVSVRNETG